MKFDTRSNEAKLLKAWCEVEIESVRSALEREQTEQKTIHLRARIKALRDLMGLPERINNGTANLEPRD